MLRFNHWCHVLGVLVLCIATLAVVHAESQQLHDGDSTVTILACEETSDCLNHGLQGSACRDKVCVENKLFPLSRADIIGSIGAFMANVLAAGSGLGGGGLLVPMYILTMGVSSHEAIPLSKATIFGSAIASLLVNIRKRHPLASDRPLIDYETMLLMEPMTLAGTIIGVNMNAIFPEWLITVLIVWLLTKTSMRTLKKARKIWTEEHNAEVALVAPIVAYWRMLPFQRRVEHFDAVVKAITKWKAFKRSEYSSVTSSKTLKLWKHEEDDTASVVSTVLSINDTDGEHGSEDEDENNSLIPSVVGGHMKKSHEDDVPVVLKDLKKYRRSVPFKDIGVLAFTWAGLVLFSLSKGGHGAPSIIGLPCGSPGYWILVSASFPFFALVTLYFGVKIARQHAVMKSCGYEYLKGDMLWTRHAVIKYPALCTAAGAAAGLLGIGGGMVKGPLLLEMGILPQVAAATSSSMILFTSSATTIQFIILGTLSVDHALWHGLVGFGAGLVGQFGLSYLIKKYRKTAVVIYLIAIVVGFSGLVMGTLGARKVVQSGFGGFRSLCPRT